MYKCGNVVKNKSEEMFNKYCYELPDNAEAVFKVVSEALKTGDFEDFSMACNFLEMLDYKSNDIPYEKKSLLEREANERARDILGADLANLYDKIVKVSNQELYCGDELYKLFGYMTVPAYVENCIVGAIFVYHTIQEGVTFDNVFALSKMVHHPFVVWEKDEDTKFVWSVLRDIACAIYEKDIDKAYTIYKENTRKGKNV